MSIEPNSYRAMHKVNNDGLFSASVWPICDFRKTALLQCSCDVEEATPQGCLTKWRTGMRHVYHDGGRATSGFQGTAGDCCARAFAIATGRPYQEVYDLINKLAGSERTGKRKRKISSARTGVFKRTAHKLAYELEPRVRWVPTMLIGQGCKVHLADGELPPGRLVVSVSRHYTAVIDGDIYDTFDPRRDASWSFEPDRGQELKPNQGRNENGVWTEIGGRCVYGYWDFTNLR